MKLSDSQIKELQEAFKIFDVNKDGLISIRDIKQLFSMLKIKHHHNDIEAFLNMIDLNGDRTIDYNEFVNIVSQFYFLPDSDENLRSVFGKFDLNNDGYISASELLSMLRIFGRKTALRDVSTIMSLVDTNRDGRINFDEFKRIMNSDIS
ncbi:hypothetical protein GJ496_000968 [Pomphorhynchus laevis]|nr:hypothetical protein GJ496_000968 [Pomphorhynchus laevis]